MNRIEIAQGAAITSFQTEQFKRCRVSVHFVWPATRANATAEALLPFLMERGYADCPDMTELSRRLAALYGASLQVSTSITGVSRVLSVSVTGIADRFALEGEALAQAYTELALGVAFRPYFIDGSFDAEAVEIEKEQLREILNSEINEKRAYCVKQARRKFFGDAPEGVERNGYPEDLDAMTAKSLTAAYQNMLQTAQIETMVLGADSAIVAQQLLAQLRLAAPARCAQPKQVARPMPRQAAQHYTQSMDAVQGKLCMLFTSGEPLVPSDMSKLRVAVALFGGTATSRLFLNVREKRSLCYYCAASALYLNGMLCVDSGVEHTNAAAAQEAIMAEFSALQTGEITEKELADTKRVLLSGIDASQDTLGGIENWYLSEILRDSDTSPEESKQQILAVTADDVRSILQRFSLSVTYLLAKEGAV